MSTVAQVAERVYRDWLHSPEDQPVILGLSQSVTAADTTWNFSHEALALDEEDLLAPGILVEAGSEQARISSVDNEANTLTVRRGTNGTVAQAHAAGSDIYVAPKFSRASVHDAVKDAVVHLYPSLWNVGTIQLTSAHAFIAIPSEVVSVTSVTDARGRPLSHAYMSGFSPSPTGRAIQLYGPSGVPVYLTYYGKFARPISDDTSLYSLGVLPEWEHIVAVGAAAQVVASADLDTLTAEYITEQLAREALPPSAPQQIRNGLLALYNVWLDEAHRALRTDHPITVTMNY